MIVYNENKTKILQDYDLSKGYLIEDKITKIIPYQPKIEEVGHYEIVKEYDNGGKDVKYIIDKEGCEERQEKTITEDILVYKPYTQAQLDKINNENEYFTLINWYNTYYTIHEQQYRRLHTLGDPTAYDKLIALYEDAEVKRKRIQELEAQLDNV